MGKYSKLFEESFAKFCETKHAIACTNGTTALHLALLAVNILPGDEVIVPTLTYIATANAVMYCGGKPTFVDCDPVSQATRKPRIKKQISVFFRILLYVIFPPLKNA